MKEIYVLATEQSQPPPLEVFQGALASEDVDIVVGEAGSLFSVKAPETRVDVRFEAASPRQKWELDQLSGSDKSIDALGRARGLYWISFEPGKPQPSVGVFEALWCARNLMEHVPGVLIDVTSFKVHDPEDVTEITELEFDIRDHVNLHAVEAALGGETPLWVHSHGMEKFGIRDVEAFRLGPEDLLPAESFLYELCTDLAFGHGPPVRTVTETSAGPHFMLLPSEEARTSLMGLPLETFDGHEGPFLTVVSGDGRHTVGDILRPYRDRFEKESPEEAAALMEQVRKLRAAFKARFQRKGLMEPLTFLVRAPFESHPDGETVQEDLWIEVLSWENDAIVGKLVDGGSKTTEWRKGAQVEFEEEQINAIALGREGRTLEDDQMQSLLLAERPM